MLFSLPLTVPTYYEGCRTGEDLEEGAGEHGHQCVTVAQGVDERGEGRAAVRQAGDGLGVEEDLLFREYGGEEGEHIADA